MIMLSSYDGQNKKISIWANLQYEDTRLPWQRFVLSKCFLGYCCYATLFDFFTVIIDVMVYQ